MDILYRFKAFILSLFEKIFQLLPRAAAPNQREPAAPAADQYNLDWAMIMIGFCLPSAVEIALQSLQTKSQLSPMFHFLSISIILSFTFLFVSKFMSTKFPVSAQVLERVGVLFAVTAIFVAITIPFPLWLNCITWVPLCHFLYRHHGLYNLQSYLLNFKLRIIYLLKSKNLCL
ncbi:hypothetical protein Patl1_18984 [Pistacia atlantica]|uniref:Uncharacterized protein n=1 Tax=Pistacia atlantica TaxID=434234 RepID=A0ACC1C057_9ROSI|nr:hypothetical protein Patl1_18984 [Pistacia atlantica]